MAFKYLLVILVSTLAGTIAMTLTMYLYSYLMHRFTKVIHILGSMLVGEPNFYSPSKKALITGSVAHFGAGLVFSSLYFLLWNWGFFRINFPAAILIGAVGGLFGIGIWKGYLNVHERPPHISRQHYFIALFIAHVAFAVASINIFRVFL